MCEGVISLEYPDTCEPKLAVASRPIPPGGLVAWLWVFEVAVLDVEVPTADERVASTLPNIYEEAQLIEFAKPPETTRLTSDEMEQIGSHMDQRHISPQLGNGGRIPSPR